MLDFGCMEWLECWSELVRCLLVSDDVVVLLCCTTVLCVAYVVDCRGERSLAIADDQC